MRSRVPPLFALFALPLPALGAPPPDYGFNFKTIGDPGNTAYQGSEAPPPFLEDAFVGRGSVPYTYRMAETEVTTAQWLEYINTFAAQPDSGVPLVNPGFWGARRDFTYQGPGRRYILRDDVADAGMLPVMGVSWRDAARFVNWLHNGKSSDPESTTHGAYDTSSFYATPDGVRHDQRTRSPGAQYWIPSLDEWLKAAHYDPEKNGPGEPGWWRFSHTSDDPPIPGLPGEGQTTAGLVSLWPSAEDIPLKAYTDVRSPWGLLDLSGGAGEWNEEWGQAGQLFQRFVGGAWAGSDPQLSFLDWAGGMTSLIAELGGAGIAGLRVASAVPSPTSVTTMTAIVILIGMQRRRQSR